MEDMDGKDFFAAQKLKIHTCGCSGDRDSVIKRNYSEKDSKYEIITPRDARARTHRHTRTRSHLHQTRRLSLRQKVSPQQI